LGDYSSYFTTPLFLISSLEISMFALGR
jgi:hypothetical protein